jgi:DGQHR domain-containing protein
MITVPAMRLHQFGVYFYQAILGVGDIQKLVRFEVLSYSDGARTHGKRPVKAGRAGKINWDVLESKIAHGAEAYQRPVIQRKIAELMDYYVQCSEVGTLPAVPGAVLLVSDRRLDFVPVSSHRILGVLQMPPAEGALRALDGQHRLLALHQLAEERPVEDVQVPAVIFDQLSPDQVVELFVTINAKHTKLNPSHLISLSGRRLYPDKLLAVSHDIIRVLNEDGSSPLHGEIKLFGVGHGRVAQAPLAEELKGVFTALDAFGGRQAAEFREHATRFFLNYFKQIARVFPKAWHGKRYSIKTAMALRAFLRVVPDVLAAIRANGDDVLEAHAILKVIEPWGSYIGETRFETDGEWRQKLAGGTRGTVDVLARELRSVLRTP